MQALILDVQSTARSFGEAAQATVERAIANTDRRLSVCPTALAIPTEGPMDSFNARTWVTWPASYVEWWFGDGAPGLERDRPMLFEQVVKRLIEIEEHEYVLETDDAPYVASCQSRFNNPEIIAVMGDVVRRLKLLKGTRAAIGRRGFDFDLNVLASALPGLQQSPVAAGGAAQPAVPRGGAAQPGLPGSDAPLLFTLEHLHKAARDGRRPFRTVGRDEASAAFQTLLHYHHGETAPGAVEITDASAFDWIRWVAHIEGARHVIRFGVHRVYVVRWEPDAAPEAVFCYGNHTYSTLVPRTARYTCLLYTSDAADE